MDKRGISGVVTAILLILLAIAAIIIVWSVVKPMIERAGSQGQADCVAVNLGIVSAKNIPAVLDDPVTTTVDESVPAVKEVTVKRNPGAGDLTGITIRVVDNADEAKTSECDETMPEELATVTCDLSADIGFTDAWKTVEVYANVGAQKTLCPNFESTSEITD